MAHDSPMISPVNEYFQNEPLIRVPYRTLNPMFSFFSCSQCHFSCPCSVLEQLACSFIPASDMRLDLQSSVELNSHSVNFTSVTYC